ncbi:unnamed protein product [Linum tenue]|uniref:Xyloglucan endotransglucosylase/hydrolase n=1 Tax=Linum tenue TaxID=586396 RepID=A0AAV0PXS1_9ROSI|nr:unnamed protein product [Linum tenue]
MGESIWIRERSSPYSPLLILITISSLLACCGANFHRDVDVTWGHDHANISDDGRLLTLTLDRLSGAGFQSKKAYLFGKFDVEMKLPPGNTAGIVTTFYLTTAEKHEEIDLEFLGNLTDDPYTLHTNVYTHEVGHREHVFVDDIPVRVFNNREAVGVPYPNTKPMKIKASIWNGEKWATRGGLVKTDWNEAPFTASYRNLEIQTMAGSVGRKNRPQWPLTQGLDKAGKKLLRWVRQTHMIYNYCHDPKRHPRECRHFIDI